MSKLGENSVKCANASSTRNYAENLRVLAVDDNVVCLKFLSALLKKCNYRFTTTTKASEAYKILMNNRDSYDLVLTNVKANMDGFRFAKMILEIQLDIPVVFVSANDGRDLVSEGVSIGADYIPKPVRLEDVRLIWKHVAKRDYLQKSSSKKYKIYPSLIDSVTWDRQNTSERETETKTQVKDDNKEVPMKKQRFKWAPEMHDKFVAAINKLGIENAIPKRILEIMNEPTLSRENVASHLQKYRKNFDKEKGHAKISSSIMNKLTIHWSQSTWPGYELQGTYLRTAENEKDRLESAACFSGGHNPNGGSMPLPTNSLPVQLLSSSNGRNQLRDSTKSLQISLPTTFIPMPPSISSYGPNQLHGSTQLTRMSYPINSRALPPSSQTHLQGPTQSIHIDETVDSIITVPPRSSCGGPTLIRDSTHPSSPNGQLERPSSLDMLQKYSEDYLNSDIENDEDLRAMWEVHSAPMLDHPN